MTQHHRITAPRAPRPHPAGATRPAGAPRAGTAPRSSGVTVHVCRSRDSGTQPRVEPTLSSTPPRHPTSHQMPPRGMPATPHDHAMAQATAPAKLGAIIIVQADPAHRSRPHAAHCGAARGTKCRPLTPPQVANTCDTSPCLRRRVPQPAKRPVQQPHASATPLRCDWTDTHNCHTTEHDRNPPNQTRAPPFSQHCTRGREKERE